MVICLENYLEKLWIHTQLIFRQAPRSNREAE